MKKVLAIMLVIVTASAMLFAFTGCTKGAISGSWKGEGENENIVFIFRSNGKFEVQTNPDPLVDVPYEFDYTYDEDDSTIHITGLGSFSCVVSDDELTIEDFFIAGNDYSGTYRK